MSQQEPSIKIAIQLAPAYQLDVLTVGTSDQAVSDKLAQTMAPLYQAATANQDYSAMAPAVFDAIVDSLKSAFAVSNLPYTDHLAGAQAMISQLQDKLASFEAQAQAAVNAAYEKGRSEAVAAATQGGQVSGGGLTIHLDTDAVARQLLLAMGSQPAAAQAQANAGQAQANAAQNQGGLSLGSGVMLGKHEAVQESSAQPVTASGATTSQALAAASQEASLYAINPATIGSGEGSGGGIVNTSNAAGKTVAQVRGDTNLEKVGLPTAKKKYAAGSIIYILPSSDSAQWDEKLAVIADPKEGGDLEQVAEGAKVVLMKTLHYYAEL